MHWKCRTNYLKWKKLFVASSCRSAEKNAIFSSTSILHRIKNPNIVEKIKLHSNVSSMDSVVFFSLLFFFFLSLSLYPSFLSICLSAAHYLCMYVCLCLYSIHFYVTLSQPFPLHTTQFLSDFRESNSALQLLANVHCTV